MDRFQRFASVSAVAFGLMGTVLGGCSQTVVDPAPTDVAPTAVSTEALTQRFNAFATAVHAGDLAALRATLSDEVITAADAMGFESFLALQKDMMTQTLGAMEQGPNGGFTVESAEVEGDAVRATIAFRGKVLEKELFFVATDDGYKLNLMRPGFTHQVPENAALGYDNYTITNTRGVGAVMKCSTDNGMKTFTSYANSTMKVSCRNTCHWYRWGSWFEDASGYRLQCTWNTFGSDVNILPGRWECKSVCF